MIAFHYATLQDKPRIDQLLQHSGERGCEYTFTNLFAWSDPYQLQVAEVEGCLTAFMTGVIGPCYLYPVGGRLPLRHSGPPGGCGPAGRAISAGLPVQRAQGGAGGLVPGLLRFCGGPARLRLPL